jgi:hypothetical protein
VGRPLWREDGSVFCICCWSSPAQTFSGPSPLDLATIFYCLSSETSLFVASYDSQGHGGGIRPRLHTGPWPKVRVRVHWDWRSVSLSVLVSSPVWGSWPDINYCLTVTVFRLSLYRLGSDFTENTCHALEYMFIGPLPRTGHAADQIGNTSNAFSIVACACFERCLELGLHAAI